MQIFHYSPATGEFLGSGVADPDPVRIGEWLIPAFATGVTPPEPEASMARVWRDGAWRQVPDHRGETWYRGREPVEVAELGDPSADDLAPEVEPLSEEQVQSAHVLAVKAEAQRRIIAVYPEWKQRNMTARGLALLRIGEANWTPEQASEADALAAAWAWVEQVRAASGGIEADTTAEPTDDTRWPGPPGA